MCFPELSLIACTEGYYFSSVSEFQLTWKHLRLPMLLVLPINEMECFPMLAKNMSNENGINTCNNVVNCSKIFLTRLGRVVELHIFTKTKTTPPHLFFIWIPLHFPYMRLIWKILNYCSPSELSLNSSTLSCH